MVISYKIAAALLGRESLDAITVCNINDVCEALNMDFGCGAEDAASGVEG
ncbi:MAG: hypothetical protein HRU19_16335 [Pseudobacteriovorax sp.]|nr:hypothetical protein [Pseudobacteriovorax sp.]